MEFEIGQIVDKENYTQAAIWCNQNSAHIEKQNDNYIIVENSKQVEPTIEDQVKIKESKTGLTRALRELILAENSNASDYVKQKAQEIENLAKQLRE